MRVDPIKPQQGKIISGKFDGEATYAGNIFTNKTMIPIV